MKRQPMKSTPTKKPTISTTSEWKRSVSEPLIIQLPSLVYVKLRRLNLFECLSTGQLPLPLLSKVLASAVKLQTPEGWGTVKEEELKGILETMKKVVELALVEPQLTEDFTIEDIPENDLAVMFDRVMRTGGLSSLISFRG